MRSLTMHLRILIAILVTIGVLTTVYQIFILGIPLTQDETDDLWNIEAKVNFVADGGKPVKVRMFVPPQGQDYVSLNESYNSKSYGVSINTVGNNRVATWSTRREKGNQVLYYWLALSKRYESTVPASKGDTSRDSLPAEGPVRIAAEGLLAPIRQYSADIETFISEAIKRVNNLDDNNVKLLLGNDTSLKNRVKVLDLVLSIAHVPLERVHTLRLQSGSKQIPELWVRSYNGKKWIYFNPETGQQGLPKDHLIWWYGDDELLNVEGGRSPEVTFSINSQEMNAIRIAQLTDAHNASSDFLDYSLYGLPLSVQNNFQVMVMIPFGVLVILVLRNLIGIQTLGTFTPVLIALAFRETQLGFGIALFTVITALGLSVRSYLEHLKLQMLPRLSVVLTFVVVLIALISLFSHKLGLERGLSVTLFPMVILTMTIERLSITWEERGGANAMKVAIGTLVAASLAYLLMNVPPLVYFVFTFPGILLILVSFMLAMGRYRGYRLTELFRFKALLKDGAQ